MSSHPWISSSRRIGIVLVLILAAGVLGRTAVARGSAVAAYSSAKLDASIFSFDGTDFVRTQTTLVTEQGKSAEGTKLDHASPAYQALVGRRSFSGEITVFGRKYDANYAPLTGDDGKVTGALFVAVRK